MADERNLSLTGNKKSRANTFTRKGKRRIFAQVTAIHSTDNTLDPRQIRYRLLDRPYSQTTGLAIAYNRSYTEVPLVGEYVEIIPGPSIDPSGRGPSLDYYLPAVDLYNHPEHGAVSVGNTTPLLAPEFIESSTVNPLIPFPGDVLLQGRRSQSIRFSENFSNTPWTSPSSSQPIIVISNGQISTTEGESYIKESPTQDAASIYLAQNQKIPLQVDYKWNRGSFQTSYTEKNVPPAASDYLGDQIVISSGRVYLNAKTESVLLSANRSVGLLGAQVHLDATETVNIEAPTIKLTGESLDPSLRKSAVKGEDLTDELTQLYKHLQNLSATLGAMAASTNNFPLVKDTTELSAFLTKSQTKLKSTLLSQRVFLS